MFHEGFKEKRLFLLGVKEKWAESYKMDFSEMWYGRYSYERHISSSLAEMVFVQVVHWPF